MKKIVALILIAVLCLGFAVPAAAAYDFMAFNNGYSAFFLTRAESGGFRALASNPFDIEQIEIIYVESGSVCTYGGMDDFAMPPMFIRVDYVHRNHRVGINPAPF